MLVDGVLTDADPIVAWVVELFCPVTVKLRVVVVVLHSKVPWVTVLPSVLSTLNFSIPLLFLTINVLSNPLKVTLSINVLIPNCVWTSNTTAPVLAERTKLLPAVVVTVDPSRTSLSIYATEKTLSLSPKDAPFVVVGWILLPKLNLFVNAEVPVTVKFLPTEKS